MMKMMNKVIVDMIAMAVIFAMPAMAGNKNHNGKKDKVVAVNNKTAHFDAHKHAYRPDVKFCTFKVSRHDSHKKVVAKVEDMKGVMDTNWNPRTRELTVRYDANKTSARSIKHFVA